jgi:hypothetical protein
MNKLHSYIILSIAEKSFEIFQKTNYSTYHSFCKKIGISIEADSLTYKEQLFLYEIMDDTKQLYGLDNYEAMKYIKFFFNLDVEDFNDYFKYIKIIESYYPISINYI